MSPARRARALQAFTIAVGTLPAASLAVSAFTDGLGANPVEQVTHVTGDWALRFLLLSLAVTPLRRLFGWSWAAPLRRTLGLTAFGYACLHYLIYLGLEHFFDWQLIVEDVLKRRYVWAGFAAFLCLVSLAATSTRAMIRRLGSALGLASPPGLSGSRPRSDPLPLARQVGPSRTAALRGGPGSLARAAALVPAGAFADRQADSQRGGITDARA